MHSYFNPYQVLGIANNANDAEIRRAYKRLALVYHPDRHSGRSQAEINEAEKKFKEINQAYETLISNKKNFTYQDDHYPEGGDDSSLVIYKEADQLAYEPTLELTDYDTHELDNIFKKWFSRSDSDNNPNNFFKFKDHSLPPLSSFSSSTSSLPYNSSHLDNLDESTILEIIATAVLRYQDIPYQINQQAFLWVAKKKDCAPIYGYGTNHAARCDFEDRFGDALDNVMDKVDIVFTEIEEEKPISTFIDLLKSLNPEHKLVKEFEHSISDSIDNFIANKAAQHNKELRPLENELVRNAALKATNSSADIQKKVSEYIIKGYKELYRKSKSEMQVITQTYLTNHYSFITKIYTRDEIKDYYKTNYNFIPDDEECEIITAFLNEGAKRTAFWMKILLSTSSQEKKPCLVSPGKAHNSGPMGLPNLLAYEGYEITLLMEKVPVSRKSIIRDLVFGKGPTLFTPSRVAEEKKDDADKQLVVFKANK